VIYATNIFNKCQILQRENQLIRSSLTLSDIFTQTNYNVLVQENKTSLRSIVETRNTWFGLSVRFESSSLIKKVTLQGVLYAVYTQQLPIVI